MGSPPSGPPPWGPPGSDPSRPTDGQAPGYGPQQPPDGRPPRYGPQRSPDGRPPGYGPQQPPYGQPPYSQRTSGGLAPYYGAGHQPGSPYGPGFDQPRGGRGQTVSYAVAVLVVVAAVIVTGVLIGVNRDGGSDSTRGQQAGGSGTPAASGRSSNPGSGSAGSGSAGSASAGSASAGSSGTAASSEPIDTARFPSAADTDAAGYFESPEAAGSAYFVDLGAHDLTALKALACPGTTVSLTEAKLEAVESAFPKGEAVVSGRTATLTGTVESKSGQEITVVAHLTTAGDLRCLVRTS